MYSKKKKKALLRDCKIHNQVKQNGFTTKWISNKSMFAFLKWMENILLWFSVETRGAE